MNISISINKTLKIFSYIIIILTLLSVLSQIYKFEFNNGEDRYITNMLNLDQERNFPTLYATLTLFFSGFVLLVISSAKKTLNNSFKKHWFILGLIFILLGTDEILQLHEQIISPLRSLLKTEGFFYITWTIPAIILLFVFLVSYVKFLKHLPTPFGRLFILSGLIYVFGAVGMEIIGSKIIVDYGQDNLFYALITNVEELFEMLGILLFIYTLLSYIKIYTNNLNFKVFD